MGVANDAYKDKEPALLQRWVPRAPFSLFSRKTRFTVMPNALAYGGEGGLILALGPISASAEGNYLELPRGREAGAMLMGCWEAASPQVP